VSRGCHASSRAKGENAIAKNRRKIDYEESSGNVFADLGLPNPQQGAALRLSKHLRRRDIDLDARALHVRRSKNEGSKRVLPLNDNALRAVKKDVPQRRRRLIDFKANEGPSSSQGISGLESAASWD
jgi:hypothetical protein